MKVLSLFDGISCGRIAFERAGIDVERYVAYEIDNNAIKISHYNYPDIERHGNVFGGKFDKYQGFDILICGSPCQFWSISQSDRETTPDGMGGKLFLECIRAYKESGVKYFLYENNYSIHQDIKDFISEQWGVQPIVINSALVSGQQRKRCYWTNIPGVTQPDDKHIYVKNILDPNIEPHSEFYCLNDRYVKSINWKQNISHNTDCPLRLGQIGTENIQGYRIYSTEGKAINLTTGEASRQWYKIDLPDGDYDLRKLSPLECERLQTLPDNYTNIPKIAPSARYKAIGNGWTVDSIAHIFSFIPH